MFPDERGERRMPIHSRLVVNTVDAAVDAAVAGLGIACVLSYQAARPIADGALRLLLDDCAQPAMPVSLVHREARLPPAKAQLR